MTLHDFHDTFGMEIVVIGDLASIVTYCNHAAVEGKNAELSDLTGGTVEEAEEFTQVVKKSLERMENEEDPEAWRVLSLPFWCTVMATEPICKGEEILLNYGSNYGEKFACDPPAIQPKVFATKEASGAESEAESSALSEEETASTDGSKDGETEDVAPEVQPEVLAAAVDQDDVDGESDAGTDCGTVAEAHGAESEAESPALSGEEPSSTDDSMDNGGAPPKGDVEPESEREADA